MPLPPRTPELLAPAGDRDCAAAAVDGGADAVYLGLADGFNARARAENFTLKELPGLLDELHRCGVRGYVAVNTLAFPCELPEVERLLRRIVAAGADAVLVQDLGVARLARAVCPELELHASTQMTLTGAESIRAVASLGLSRVVLARELSIGQVAAIRRETTIGLEVFVHGALCVSYSGQCLASLSLGGRSANRGRCAQACRMPYTLVCDGQPRTLGDKRFLLSPLDLAAWDLLPQLVSAGVDAVKIEGRLKSADYVAAVTALYREAIDAAAAGRPFAMPPERREEIEAAFSRGLSHGWLEGTSHRTLVPGTSSSKQGVPAGTVVAVAGQRVRVQPACTLRRGDGIVFVGRAERSESHQNARSDDDAIPQGGRIYEIFTRRRSVEEARPGQLVELAFARGAIDFTRIHPGQGLSKTGDPRVERRLRAGRRGRGGKRQVALDLAIEAAVGRPLSLSARAESGAVCQLESPQPLVKAHKHPLTEEVLREQLGRLGGTAYALRRLESRIDAGPMVPLSVLGALRREMVARLDASVAGPRYRTATGSALEALRAGRSHALTGQTAAAAAAPPTLHVLCRAPCQVELCLALGVRSLIADFAEPSAYRQATSAARAAGAEILLATPRIQKPGEAERTAALAEHNPHGILVRNLAALELFTGRGEGMLVADYSLNAVNDLSVAWLVGRGAARVTAACDLSPQGVLDLAAAAGPENLEVVVHHHPPMFHTEYCLFCGLLSEGHDASDCGRPCRTHRVRLRDHTGAEHPLAAEPDCRNTVFKGTPHSTAGQLPAMVRAGLRHFRIELLETTGAEGIRSLIELYRGLLVPRNLAVSGPSS